MLDTYPATWRERIFTRDDIAKFAAAPPDTVYAWTRLSAAADERFGCTVNGRLMYNRRDLYRAGILGGLRSIGIGVGPAEVVRVNSFTEFGPPVEFFEVRSPTGHAAAMIDAPAIYHCADISTPKVVVAPNA